MQSSLDYLALGNGLVGGLALFLFGMRRLTEALRRAAGADMQRLLSSLTTNRFSAAVAGAVVTAVIQSSSVTTVMVVSFVSAGVLPFARSVGVIVGANVGTTITAQIIAFKVTSLAPAMIAAGLLLEVIARRRRLRHYGAMLMGLGLLFFGMNLMSDAAAPLRDHAPFVSLMRDLHNPLLALLAAALFTAAVQSSSATTGIIIVLGSQGFVDLEAAIALVLGANVGTCVTALLSAVGRPRDAVKAAMVHVIFNVAGALLLIGFIPAFADLVRSLSTTGAAGTAATAAQLPRQIANAHSLFNLGATLLFLCFTDSLAGLVERLVPRPRQQLRDPAAPRYLETLYLKQPGLGLDRARLELQRLGRRMSHTLQRAMAEALTGERAQLERLRARTDVAGRLHDAIVDYLGQLSRQELSPDEARRLERYLALADHLEGMRELVAHGFIVCARHRLRRGADYDPALAGELAALNDRVAEALERALRTFAERDSDTSLTVVRSKVDLYRPAEKLRRRLGQELPAQGPRAVATYLTALEHIDNLRRAHALARRIARLYLRDTGTPPTDAAPDSGPPGNAAQNPTA